MRQVAKSEFTVSKRANVTIFNYHRPDRNKVDQFYHPIFLIKQNYIAFGVLVSLKDFTPIALNQGSQTQIDSGAVSVSRRGHAGRIKK